MEISGRSTWEEEGEERAGLVNLEGQTETRRERVADPEWTDPALSELISVRTTMVVNGIAMGELTIRQVTPLTAPEVTAATAVTDS